MCFWNTQEAALVKQVSPTEDKSNGPGIGSDLSFLDLLPEEVARQLTLIDFEIFKKIHPTEFVDKAWAGKQKETKAPNVLALIERFNKVWDI